MRKPLVAVTTALLGCVMVASTAGPAAVAAPWVGDAKRPCADVVEGNAIYESILDGNTPVASEVRAEMELGATACKNVKYTMTVLAGDTDPTVLASVVGTPSRPTDDPNVPPRVEFATKLPAADPASDVCLVITTTKRNGKIFDRAPDTGCNTLIIDDIAASLLRFR